MSKEKSFLAISLLIISLPSCMKTYKLAPSESPQGKEYKDQRSVVDENLRSVKVYDQWETEAMFDVLWVSDSTTKSYVDRYCERRGKSMVEHDDMLQEELAKNREDMKFYVLADVRDKFNPSLSDPNAAWTMYLELADGRKIAASKVKEVELSPEILEIFGHRFRKPKFKTPYEATFSAGSLNNRDQFKMIISSTSRRCELGWLGGHPVCVKKIEDTCCKDPNKVNKKRKLIKDEDYYWI